MRQMDGKRRWRSLRGVTILVTGLQGSWRGLKGRMKGLMILLREVRTQRNDVYCRGDTDIHNNEFGGASDVLARKDKHRVVCGVRYYSQSI